MPCIGPCVGSMRPPKLVASASMARVALATSAAAPTEDAHKPYVVIRCESDHVLSKGTCRPGCGGGRACCQRGAAADGGHVQAAGDQGDQRGGRGDHILLPRHLHVPRMHPGGRLGHAVHQPETGAPQPAKLGHDACHARRPCLPQCQCLGNVRCAVTAHLPGARLVISRVSGKSWHPQHLRCTCSQVLSCEGVRTSRCPPSRTRIGCRSWASTALLAWAWC